MKKMADKKESEVIILIAMDDSKYCDYAFDWYLENVRKPTDFVIFLHCMELNSLATMSGDIGASGLLMRSIEQERAAAYKYLNELTERMKAAGIRGKVKRTHGEARSEILRVAEEEKVDMIITGTRGLGTVRRILLCNISDHVLYHSHVHVIICKHKDDDNHREKHKEIM